MEEFPAAWLEWQREHAAALEALQEAQRAYHRTVTDSAFWNPSRTLQKASLEQMEAARVRLDEIRARRPV